MKILSLVVKRLFDILLSTLLLILLSPFLIVVILILWLSDPGPIFFLQERVGKDNVLFNIYKFRTMRVDRHAEESMDSLKDEERTFAFGRFMRRFKIDELPQLLNVLLNDMSLIGPRPTYKKQVDSYSEFQLKRLKMKPGMTGWAQVNGNATITWENRIIYDVEYVENFSLGLDLKILLKTIAIVLLGEEKFSKNRL
jgi:undecaprenyl phosphate N,N'-diacetylbacillosamine 1-phosphate transferase